MADKSLLALHNPDLTIEERVQSLLAALTTEEKIGLMPTKQAAVPRLGVPEFWVGGEAAHGLVAREGSTTVFPQTIGLSSTWDPDLMVRIGNAVGNEARVYSRRKDGMGGLTLWAPTVDMERDPRWGRTEEAYGEDPHLTGTMSTAYVKGMQGDDPFYLKSVPTLKHFYANNNEKDRLSSSSSIDPRNKREYYLKAFEPAVREGRVHSIMTAYNEINGTPAIVHPDVQGVLKGEWQLDGFVVCDGADMHQTVDDHQYCRTYAEAVALAIKAGIDCVTDDSELVKQSVREALEQGLLETADLDRAIANVFRIRIRLGQFDPDSRNPYAGIPDAVLYSPAHRELALEAARKSAVLLKNDQSLLPLDKCAVRKLAVIGPLADAVYRDWYTGNPPYKVTPLAGIAAKLPAEAVVFHDGCDRVAFQSAVNGRYIGTRDWNNGSLAADKLSPEPAERFVHTDWGFGQSTFRSLANGKYMTTGDDLTVGANADDIWGWFVKEQFSIVDQPGGICSLRTWNGGVVTAHGDGSELLRVEEDENDASSTMANAAFYKHVISDGTAAAAETARHADAAIVFVGNHPLINGKEEIDRPDLTLPASQQKLIREVCAVNPNTVIVIVGSYPFALGDLAELAPSILYMAHGGQEHGRAAADILFGDYNPAGRLSMTWYRSKDQLPDMMEYDIRKGKRTYMYFDGDPLYPFGHGLSYTSFHYLSLSLNELRASPDELVTAYIEVQNSGPAAGEEVLQLYARCEQSLIPRPAKQLIGYKRICLEAGESARVPITFRVSDLAIWDVSRDRYCVEGGPYVIMAGASSADIRCTAKLDVIGEAIPARDITHQTRAENYDDYEGFRLGESKEGGTCTMVSGTEGWLLFRNVQLGSGLLTLQARCSSADLSGSGALDLHLGDLNSSAVLSCQVACSGDQQWQTVSGSFAIAEAGTADVYLRLRGRIKLSWFQISH
ncbi:glycoside hydrolase family 3 C-terminal domain-containing protein [Paenibacillus sambharensis]|uniref:glycoside hydrolase family 3 C-terminal domain-containing protein n=1 Tax=Paenibacillus sambharensis TaxID=1803190 RepID=UPI001FE99B8C|nr:glycoside hydrolase family 3 C-terminal domain-containing protein [Paenibacillus sambharensis]